MDVLTDRLFENVWANRNPYVVRMHERNGRAGFKFMVTAWSVEQTGGPKCYPGRNMHDAHVHIVTTEHDFDVVVLEIAATLSFCGVGVQEQKEYLEIIESFRREVIDAPQNAKSKEVAAWSTTWTLDAAGRGPRCACRKVKATDEKSQLRSALTWAWGWGLEAGAPRSTFSNSAAAHSALPLAHAPVLIRPRARMPTPRPNTSHRTPCSESVNTVPPPTDPTIVPAIATPRVVPVCLPAEASEVATPAIERGMPETAVLVIGGLMVP
ncbi:MAG: hypothetical protein JO287_24280 [Pseudonocardiales bacterium]|nr:hypothetical protein [Pseudonocardiales bacterium]